MAQAAAQSASDTPTREDFARLIDESFSDGHVQEGSVVKGTVVAIERDMAVIDVGLKTEGRVAMREFAGPGRGSEIKIGDTVEVYLDRVENALGEAVLSRDKARREESWGKLEKAFQNNEKVQGVIFNQVKGGFTVDLDGAVAFLRAALQRRHRPGRHEGASVRGRRSGRGLSHPRRRRFWPRRRLRPRGLSRRQSRRCAADGRAHAQSLSRPPRHGGRKLFGLHPPSRGRRAQNVVRNPGG